MCSHQPWADSISIPYKWLRCPLSCSPILGKRFAQCSVTQRKDRVQNSHGSKYKVSLEIKKQRQLASASQGCSSLLIPEQPDSKDGMSCHSDWQIWWFTYCYAFFSWLSIGWEMRKRGDFCFQRVLCLLMERFLMAVLYVCYKEVLSSWHNLLVVWHWGGLKEPGDALPPTPKKKGLHFWKCNRII